MDELIIGMIGCGGRANKYHLGALETLPGVRIAAVCDLDVQRAQATAGPLRANAYSHYEKLLSEEPLDAVLIATPAVARGGPELACVEAGIPFLVEKPVAVDWETATNVADKVRAAGLITCVGYQLRYAPQSRAVSRWCLQRRVGMAEGRYWCGAARRFDELGRKLEINQLLEQVTHTFDLMRHWLGEVEEVYSHQSRALRPSRADDSVPDVYVVSLRFAGGAIASVTSTWGTHPSIGEANVVNLFAGDEHVAYRRNVVDHTPGDTLAPIEGPTMHEAFFDAVRTGDKSQILTPYEDAVKTLAISLAADRSAATGKPVPLDAPHILRNIPKVDD